MWICSWKTGIFLFKFKILFLIKSCFLSSQVWPLVFYIYGVFLAFPPLNSLFLLIFLNLQWPSNIIKYQTKKLEHISLAKINRKTSLKVNSGSRTQRTARCGCFGWRRPNPCPEVLTYICHQTGATHLWARIYHPDHTSVPAYEAVVSASYVQTVVGVNTEATPTCCLTLCLCWRTCCLNGCECTLNLVRRVVSDRKSDKIIVSCIFHFLFGPVLFFLLLVCFMYEINNWWGRGGSLLKWLK